MEHLAPVHPGEVLWHEFMEPLSLSQNALATAIGVPPRRINEIVHGARRITADTALRLSRYFSTSAALWLNLQSHHDLEVAEESLGDALAQIRPRELQPG